MITINDVYKAMRKRGANKTQSFWGAAGAAAIIAVAGAAGTLLGGPLGGVLLAGIAEGAIYVAIHGYKPQKESGYQTTTGQYSYDPNHKPGKTPKPGSNKTTTTTNYQNGIQYTTTTKNKPNNKTIINQIGKNINNAVKNQEKQLSKAKTLTQSTYQTGGVQVGTTVPNMNNKDIKNNKNNKNKPKNNKDSKNNKQNNKSNNKNKSNQRTVTQSTYQTGGVAVGTTVKVKSNKPKSNSKSQNKSNSKPATNKQNNKAKGGRRR